MQVNDAEGRDTTMMILRPKGKDPQMIDNYTSVAAGSSEAESYRVLHNRRTSDLWNMAFQDHKKKIPTCNARLDWDYSKQEKRGLAWISCLRCSNCGYQSPRKKLYEEVASTRPGRKAAQLNVAMSLGQMGTSLTTEGMRGMFLTANVLPASASSMQESANKVGQKITEVNKMSMRKIRHEVQEKNMQCGLPATTPIRVEGDARYNNSMFSGVGRTPFQAATQVTYTMCENVTNRKKIISVYCGNKLCKQGEILKRRGIPVTCPNHDNCTANLPADSNIGDEKRWAGECMDEIGNDHSPLTVDYLTTDGDSSASLGAAEKQGKPIENLKDLRHFFDSQRKQTCKAAFSALMFKGRTKADRESFKKKICTRLKIEMPNRI